MKIGGILAFALAAFSLLVSGDPADANVRCENIYKDFSDCFLELGERMNNYQENVTSEKGVAAVCSHWEEFHTCALTALADCQGEVSSIWETLRQDSKKMRFQGSLFDLCSPSSSPGIRLPRSKVLVMSTESSSFQLHSVEPVFLPPEGQLFYTGPNRQYMRLVVLSEAQKEAALQQCHSVRCSGRHNGIRSTRNAVVSTYYWSTITEDVKAWVREPWEVVGMDLIGPLRDTANRNQYVLAMTDLHTKWVVADALQTKSGTEVATAIVSKLYLFGMVRKIITNQGKALVNEKIECTNQNIKDALEKYSNEQQDDWDVHLQAIVYGINTAKQTSTAETPYYLFFHRHPRISEVTDTRPMEGSLSMVEGDPEDELERALTAVKALNAEVLGHIETVEDQQKKASSQRKAKQAGPRDKGLHGRPYLGPMLEATREEPATLPAVLVKDEETVSKEVQTVSDSQLETHQLREPKVENLEDHCYAASPTLADHQYASHGPLWLRECDALQEELMNYELDPSRPALILQEGNICLTKENLWSVGLQHYIERNVSLWELGVWYWGVLHVHHFKITVKDSQII
ncbi:unnamed protein product [Tetraodon nigroviridis]|uniref:(spotted green pufferfish) hypothetical protein n=1 Tax=Tetraodon nigroviridis TaxID=99883 RepID=Q4SR91_TETNG|nr:unnamed protein product [Tetraodon nigroviridis]